MVYSTGGGVKTESVRVTFGGQYLRINNIVACTSLSGQNVGAQTGEKLTQKYVWHAVE